VVDTYGDSFDEWCPFLPDDETRTALVLQKIAASEDYTAALSPLSKDIVERFQTARSKNSVVILAIDIWTLCIARYRELIEIVDRTERFINLGILVIWNPLDDETVQRRETLLDALRRSMPNLVLMRDPLVFHESVESSKHLEEALRSTLAAITRRIVQFGTPMRKVDAPVARPLLKK
jgi:FxsC-like protein